MLQFRRYDDAVLRHGRAAGDEPRLAEPAARARPDLGLRVVLMAVERVPVDHRQFLSVLLHHPLH